jgi:glycyl-tRNA synthetase beta chain
MPSSHIRAALVQLPERIGTELRSAEIAVRELRAFGTCRRLTIKGEFAAAQEDREEVVTGPPKKVAFLPDGTFSPAALGFARAQEVPVESLHEIQTEKGEYLGLKKVRKGEPAEAILTRVIPQIIVSLSFPKMMRWGTGTLRFSRPIKNILCLFGHNPVLFAVEGIASTDFTSGHRLLSPGRLKVESFEDYERQLLAHKVIIDQEKRRQMILDQAENLLALQKAQLYADEELLEELTGNVEHPHVFLGAFPEKYLELPIEVLSAALKQGQKLFSVVRGKKQLPLFLGVADASADPRSRIQEGNERVIRARLEDARFFWEQDQKTPLEERASGLNRVIFQEKLGSYEEKCQRLKRITSYLCEKVGSEEIKRDLSQAAELCKADLLTEMVREFPSLQGKMGGLYARKEGFSEEISQAIYEHYQPVGLEDDAPSSLGGSLLSLADKLDSLVGVAGVGIQTTGSSDPFGLRRNAHGICKVILRNKLSFSFGRLLDKVIAICGEKLERPREEIKRYCLEFFENRLRFIYEKEGFRYDLANAALGAGIDNIYFSYLRLKALDSLKASPQFEPLILLAKRVNNIIREQPPCSLNPDLLVEKEEEEFYSIFSIVRGNVLPLLAKGDFLQAQKIVFRLESSLNTFFDKVLIMAEDKKLRKNRLALLQAVSKVLGQIADYSQVVIEGGEKS